MPLSAKVISKGQTTIPKEVREALGLKPGDLILWEVAEGRAWCAGWSPWTWPT